MVILGREHKLAQHGSGEPAAADAATPNRLASVSLEVANLEESIAFYNSAFGLQLVTSLEEEPLPRAVLATDLSPHSFRVELLCPSDATSSNAEDASLEAVAATLAGAAAPPSVTPAPAQPQQGNHTPSPTAPATGLGHFALAVADANAAVAALRAGGYADLILDECSAVIPVRSHGRSVTDRTARVRDLSGYTWQLTEIHSGKVRERLVSIMVHVSDLAASLAWYTGVLGMQVHQEYESHETGYLSALVGYGPELRCTLLELRQQWQPAPANAPAQTVSLQQAQQQAQPLTAADDDAAAAALASMAQQPPKQLKEHQCSFIIETQDLRIVEQHLQAAQQAFFRVIIPGGEAAGWEPVQALALVDADGWRFCFVAVPAAGAHQAGSSSAAGVADMEE